MNEALWQLRSGIQDQQTLEWRRRIQELKDQSDRERIERLYGSNGGGSSSGSQDLYLKRRAAFKTGLMLGGFLSFFRYLMNRMGISAFGGPTQLKDVPREIIPSFLIGVPLGIGLSYLVDKHAR